ncbi:MAG: EamA family transporter [Oscillochloris sp.]|nr:EamA family transporter [Oscillochloris sp.]
MTDRSVSTRGWGRIRSALNPAMLLVYALLLTASTLTVIGEVLLKLGINQVTARVGAFSLSPNVLIATFSDWRVLLGFVLVFGGALFWLGVISRVNLSLAYPLLALNYVIILIPSRWLLHEPITPAKVIGAMIVVIGVIVITVGSAKG